MALFVAGICLAAGLNAKAADLSGHYAWKPMKIGGGGWVVGMNISPTEKGLIYVRADVSGAYRWNPTTSTWKQLVTSASMPADSVGYAKYAGVDSIVSAPKDPEVAYMAFAGQPYGEAIGQIFRSTNRGDTWIATNFKTNQVKMEPNGKGRQEGERLCVDPNNSDVVYFGSIADGLWTTQNGGAAWTKVAGLPAGTAPHGVNTVHFDKAAGVLASKTNGVRTKVIYVTVNEGGVFKTSDAGATWTQIANSGPGLTGMPHDAAIGPDSTYYVAFTKDQDKAKKKEFAGSVWKCSPDGVWTNITPTDAKGGDQAYWELAVDPADARHIVVMRNGGRCWNSTDQGATWTVHMFHLNSRNVQWLGKQTGNYFLSAGALAFDPFERGKLWFAEGFGVWWTKDLTTPNIEWQAASEGIEEMCGNDVIAPPGGKPVAAMWDLGAFYFSGVDSYTAQRSQPYFMSCWALDWCPADPKFIVGVFRNHLGISPHPNSTGYSTDGGQTWTRFPAVNHGSAPAELEFGVIAVSANRTDNIVWAPAMKKLPYYTTDKGATWQQSSFGGPTNTGFWSYASPHKPLCADRVLPDTFYCYRPEDGVYCSTNGGANFVKAGNPVPQRWNSILKSTPGHARDLWFAEGTVGGVWHSTTGGATWTQAPGIKQAFNVGLGKPEKDGGYPTVFVAGIAGNQTGIYRSTDAGATWDKVGNYPLGIFDYVDAMDGDKEVFGKVYMGFAGSGFAYGAVKAP